MIMTSSLSIIVIIKNTVQYKAILLEDTDRQHSFAGIVSGISINYLWNGT